MLGSTHVIYESGSQSDSHFHVPISLRAGNRVVTTDALLDSGASTVFINRHFVDQHSLPTYLFRHPIPLYNIDGSINKAGSITHYVDFVLEIGDHKHHQIMAITDIDDQDVIIGIDWLRKHNPNIDWKNGTVTLSRCPPTCKMHQPEVITETPTTPMPKTKKKVRFTRISTPEEEEFDYDQIYEKIYTELLQNILS